MIRTMTMEDYDGVYALWTKIRGFGLRSVDDSREGIERFLRRNPATSVVAVEDGRVVGSCGVTNVSGDGEIDNVVVDEACRNRGIATALLRETLRRGYAMGVEAFTLEVRVSNAPAIHVYEKVGFVSEGIRPRFYEKPTEDAMILWKRHRDAGTEKA